MEDLKYKGMYVPVGSTVSMGSTPNIPSELIDKKLVCREAQQARASKCTQCVFHPKPYHNEACGMLQCHPADREDHLDVIFVRAVSEHVQELQKQLEQLQQESHECSLAYFKMRTAVDARIAKAQKYSNLPLEVVHTPEGGIQLTQPKIKLLAVPCYGEYGCRDCMLHTICNRPYLNCQNKEGMRCIFITARALATYNRYVELQRKIHELNVAIDAELQS